MVEKRQDGDPALERDSLLRKALRTNDLRTWKQLARDHEFGDIYRGMQSGNPNSFVMAADLYMGGGAVPNDFRFALQLLTTALDNSPATLHQQIEERIRVVRERLANAPDQGEIVEEEPSDAITIQINDAHVQAAHRFHGLRTPSQE